MILPGLRVPHLASKILGMVTRRLGADWLEAYGYAPVHVETGRFAGTSYKTANSIHVGQTKGCGKLDRNNEPALPVKDVYLCPLRRSYRQILTAPLLSCQPAQFTGAVLADAARRSPNMYASCKRSMGRCLDGVPTRSARHAKLIARTLVRGVLPTMSAADAHRDSEWSMSAHCRSLT